MRCCYELYSKNKKPTAIHCLDQAASQPPFICAAILHRRIYPPIHTFILPLLDGSGHYDIAILEFATNQSSHHHPTASQPWDHDCTTCGPSAGELPPNPSRHQRHHLIFIILLLWPRCCLAITSGCRPYHCDQPYHCRPYHCENKIKWTTWSDSILKRFRAILFWCSLVLSEF